MDLHNGLDIEVYDLRPTDLHTVLLLLLLLPLLLLLKYVSFIFVRICCVFLCFILLFSARRGK